MTTKVKKISQDLTGNLLVSVYLNYQHLVLLSVRCGLRAARCTSTLLCDTAFGHDSRFSVLGLGSLLHNTLELCALSTIEGLKKAVKTISRFCTSTFKTSL